MKISIITPCYNAAKYIEQTMTSILNQGYSNLEYIIIDGGSTDGTVEIIKKYADQLAYWVSEPDKGQSDAINKGIAVATGDVFNWINADDYLEPNVLELIATEFQEYKIDVVCTKTNLVDVNGFFLRINEATHIDWSFQRLMSYFGLNQQGMYWKLDVIRQLNGVNSSFNYGMDLDLWKRYLLSFGLDRTKKLNLISANFRLLETSKTGSDFEINAHLFQEENNAALVQYANEQGEAYVKSIQYLFPNYKKELANQKVHSMLPKQLVKKWLLELFYSKAKDLFYSNNFKATYELLTLIPTDEYDGDELKNLKSFKRWSLIRKWI